MADFSWLRIGPGRVTFEIQARPGAARRGIVRVNDRGLVIALNAPPEKGKANDELMDFLAESIGVPRSSLAIVRGSSTRLKLAQITTANVETIASRIKELTERSAGA